MLLGRKYSTFKPGVLMHYKVGPDNLLKESFSQLWNYNREGWARRFFNNWKTALKWQRLKPYEKFAEMIENHWGGIAAYCKSENE